MGTKTKLKVIHENKDKLGLVFTPRDYFKDYKYPFFYDNGAFSAYVNEQEWNSESFLNGLKEVMFYENKPDFCVLPDIVAGGKKSLKRSITWLDILQYRYDTYYDWYLAVQDGILPSDIIDIIKYSSYISGIFVGGTIEWKLKTLPKWVELSRNWERKIHVGRIGTLKRILYCERLGVDSVDSSNFIKNKIHWDQLMDWLNPNRKQIILSNFILNQ